MDKALHLKKIADLLLTEDPSDDWGCAVLNLACVTALGLGDRWISYDDGRSVSDEAFAPVAMAA